MINGIITSATGQAYWSEKTRRKVFYQYPQGAAPLMGLLSLLEDHESDKTEYGWWEERFEDYVTTTAQLATTGPFGTDDASPTAKAAGWTAAVGSSFSVTVTDASKFRERDIVWVKDVDGNVSGVIQVYGRITAVNVESGVLFVRAVKAVPAAKNDTVQNDRNVILIGSATGEGDRSRTGQTTRPIEIMNYSQIFRTAFSLTRNALKAGLRYDSSGEYKTAAKKNALRHMIMLERAFFFGQRGSQTVVNDDGESVPEKTMGGLEWFLDQWELGNTDNGGEFDYRPGEDSVASSAWQTTDDKRICDVAGAMTKSEFYGILERLFRYTNDESFEKLCLCGSGFIMAFNEFIDNNTIVQRKLFETGKGGFNLMEWESPFGTIYMKSHPLLNEHSWCRNDAYFLDLGDIQYVYAQDADTTLLKNRQANDADKRKDEWMTECGLELRYPEQNLILRGVTSIG